MDQQSWIIVAGAAVAIVAVLSAWRQTVRAAEIGVGGKELAVVAGLLHDLRTPEFRDAFDAAVRLPADLELPMGFDSLAAPDRESAQLVTEAFDDIGGLVAGQLVRAETILPLVSTRAMRAWHALAPAIAAERDHRARTYPAEVNPTFAPHFELLVAAARVRQQAHREARPAKIR
ncbi:hypothetical protein F4553_007544 [Allocatelliglobosispora scoriae]|uniref:Uncharacterized protein n=1 Tax=Allocatelliglobosispora scoriae TaxID=643052 RepID=A0A841C582_9ACTN|nr:hypothetical protein [Allocatelliglobosispora scoriae]MBB5874110.1 hypothetical protein [Allocatelliglobosispora scoriae]